MKIEIKDIIDFNKLPNWKVLDLISKLSNELSNNNQMPEYSSNNIKDILFNFIEHYEIV